MIKILKITWSLSALTRWRVGCGCEAECVTHARFLLQQASCWPATRILPRPHHLVALFKSTTKVPLGVWNNHRKATKSSKISPILATVRDFLAKLKTPSNLDEASWNSQEMILNTWEPKAPYPSPSIFS